jgi:protein HIRA/HIR1
VTDLAWAPDESKLATCSLDNTCMVWDVSRDMGAQRLHCIATLRHGSMVKGIAWDPMGKYLSSASDDRSVVIWRCADWLQEHRCDQPYQKEGRAFFRRLSWSPDGVYVATSHGYKEPQHISPLLRRTKSFTIECDFVGHKKAIVSTRFNPVIFKQAASDSDSAKNGVAAQDDSGGASASAPSKGGGVPKHYTCVAIGSQDKSFSVWIASQVRPIVVSQTFFEGSVLDLSWGHDGYTLMACSYDGSVVMFRFDPRELGAAVSTQERAQILTALYGSTSNDLGSRRAHIPESTDQLDMEQGAHQRQPQLAVAASASASTLSVPDVGGASAPQAATLLPTRSKHKSGQQQQQQQQQLASALSSRQGGAASAGAESAASRNLAQQSSVVHQPMVRSSSKGGKRRIAPMLISPAVAPASSSGGGGGGGGTMDGFTSSSQQHGLKRRVEGLPVDASRSGSSISRPPFSSSSQQGGHGIRVVGGGSPPAKRLRHGDDSPHGAISSPAPMLTRHAGSSSPARSSQQLVQPAADMRPTQPLVHGRRSAVAAAPAGQQGPLVREVGSPAQRIVLEAGLEEAAGARRGGGGGGGVRHAVVLRVSGSVAGEPEPLSWQDELLGAAGSAGTASAPCPSALAGNGRTWVAVGAADGSLYTYTLRGRRLLPAM